LEVGDTIVLAVGIPRAVNNGPIDESVEAAFNQDVVAIKTSNASPKVMELLSAQGRFTTEKQIYHVYIRKGLTYDLL